MKKLTKTFRFQGTKKKKNYFEGWYFKMVSKDQKTTLAFIPGISLNKENSHSFIQVFLYEKKEIDVLETHYITYSVDDFEYNKELETTRINGNQFSYHTLSLNHHSDDISISGDLVFTDSTPVQTSVLSPSIMGFFDYVPLMECYHSIVSMSHSVEGTITINDKVYDFSNGKGYIEKDYGRSFPREYIWLQSNNFTNKETSFMFSYAVIPFLGLHFKGVICNLVLNGSEYRFATYNFSSCKIIDVSNNEVKIELKRGKYRLIISAYSSDFKELPSPVMGEMKNKIKEGLSGVITIQLFEKERLIYEDIGTSSGIEIMMK